MTNQEAIEILNEMKVYSTKKFDALQLAIKALEQESLEVKATELQKAYNKGFDDCRQAALDVFGLSEKSRKYGGDHSGYDTMMKYEIQDILESLPPVKPQPICEEREKGECPYYAG